MGGRSWSPSWSMTSRSGGSVRAVVIVVIVVVGIGVLATVGIVVATVLGALIAMR